VTVVAFQKVHPSPVLGPAAEYKDAFNEPLGDGYLGTTNHNFKDGLSVGRDLQALSHASSRIRPGKGQDKFSP